MQSAKSFDIATRMYYTGIDPFSKKLVIHLFAWFRLVPASGNFRNASDSDRSMSSEKGSIMPMTYDSRECSRVHPVRLG